MSVESVLAVARGEVGYTETGGKDGNDGNVTKYWAELDPPMQGEPWCGAFVSWSFKHGGEPLPAIDKPYGFVYVPDALNWAKQHGQWYANPQPGDIALYSFQTGQVVHCGIVATPPDASGDFYAYEGNTEQGNDADGGHVMYRLRPIGATSGFLRPVFTQANTPPIQAEEDDMPITVTDPKCGRFWIVDKFGGVDSFNKDGIPNGSGAQFLGALTDHPQWNAGEGHAEGPVIGAAPWDDGNPKGSGYVIVTQDQAGGLHYYNFNSDARYAAA